MPCKVADMRDWRARAVRAAPQMRASPISPLKNARPPEPTAPLGPDPRPSMTWPKLVLEAVWPLKYVTRFVESGTPLTNNWIAPDDDLVKAMWDQTPAGMELVLVTDVTRDGLDEPRHASRTRPLVRERTAWTAACCG